MSDVVIFHNPNCSTSRHAVEVAAEMGVSVTERRYLLKAERLDRSEILALAGILEDPVTDLVRRDANFTKLGLTDADPRARRSGDRRSPQGPRGALPRLIEAQSSIRYEVIDSEPRSQPSMRVLAVVSAASARPAR